MVKFGTFTARRDHIIVVSDGKQFRSRSPLLLIDYIRSVSRHTTLTTAEIRLVKISLKQVSLI